MQKTGFLLIVLSLFISFCNPEKKFDKQIRVLDSLTIELEKSQAVYKTIDTLKLLQKLSEYQKNVAFISSEVKDTINSKDGELINAYRGMSNALMYLLNRNREFLAEIEISKKQLKDLSTDMKNNKIDDLKAFEFYTKEENNAGALIEQITKDVEMAKTEIGRFDSLNGEVKAFIGRYSTEKKQN
jgi:hypothetical protein